MKASTLLMALALTSGAQAEEWLSVGAAMAAPQATKKQTSDASQQATMASAAPTASNKGSSGIVSELSARVEQLQQEVEMLRGRVEEQDNSLKRLQEESQTRYLDLDRRLAALVKAPSSAAVDNSSLGESSDALYQRAMGFIRDKKYPEASDAFDRFITSYPKDPLISNALYWSGEVWLVRGELDRALVQFKRVVKEFPGSEKAADATYIVGVTLHRQDKTAEAKVWLKRVIVNYQGKADSTVRLAKAYLEKI
jgi:tol-pal system protein YbgF